MHTLNRHNYTEQLADGFDVRHIYLQVLSCIDQSFDAWSDATESAPRSLGVEIATDHAKTEEGRPAVVTTIDARALELRPVDGSSPLQARRAERMQAERFIAAALSAAARRANRGISRVTLTLREPSNPERPVVWSATLSRPRTVPPRQFRRTRAAFSAGETAERLPGKRPQSDSPSENLNCHQRRQSVPAVG